MMERLIEWLRKWGILPPEPKLEPVRAPRSKPIRN